MRNSENMSSLTPLGKGARKRIAAFTERVCKDPGSSHDRAGHLTVDLYTRLTELCERRMPERACNSP